MPTYIVQLDYKEFTFDNGDAAMFFAETAFRHQTDIYTISVKIVKREKGEKDASHIDDEI